MKPIIYIDDGKVTLMLDLYKPRCRPDVVSFTLLLILNVRYVVLLFVHI